MSDRRPDFKRNEYLEEYLQEVNKILFYSEEFALKEKKGHDYPVVFIMGAPRCGSTLMMQWAAETNVFSYPSNFLSRFYGAPIVGAMIERLLTDKKYCFRDELAELYGINTRFNSENGKTSGVKQPNEFWYFWRRFIPNNVYEYSTDMLMESVDTGLFCEEMLGVASVFEKSLILKGSICNFNIDFLDRLFKKKVFLVLRRDKENQIRSILNARERQYGDKKIWYSFKNPLYEELIKIDDPFTQVKEQVECIYSAIDEGVKDLPDEEKYSITYEDFCQNPKEVYCGLLSRLKKQGYCIDEDYHGADSFVIRQAKRGL